MFVVFVCLVSIYNLCDLPFILKKYSLHVQLSIHTLYSFFIKTPRLYKLQVPQTPGSVCGSMKDRCPSNPVSRKQQQKLSQTLCVKSVSGFSLFLNQYPSPSPWPVTPAWCGPDDTLSHLSSCHPSAGLLSSGHTDLLPVLRRCVWSVLPQVLCTF